MASDIQNKQSVQNQQDPSDEVLMLSYQQGSEEAFQILFKRHQSKVYGFLLKKSGSESIASDLTQETFLKVHKSKHLYNPNFQVKPWFFSITNSVLIDYYRKEGKSPAVYGFDFDKVAIVEEVPSRTIESMGSLLSGLTENQKKAIELRYVDEKTFDEIAKILNTSQMNVRQMISRGIANLKSLVRNIEKG